MIHCFSLRLAQLVKLMVKNKKVIEKVIGIKKNILSLRWCWLFWEVMLFNFTFRWKSSGQLYQHIFKPVEAN
jgi:hypothetical protein